VTTTPWLSKHEIRWTALTEARLAVLDHRLASRMARFREVTAAIVERVMDRIDRLALTQAISQLNGVDRRLLSVWPWSTGIDPGD
jgi:CRP/FNR family transcriptional regulator, cyclic AMP receptor protein